MQLVEGWGDLPPFSLVAGASIAPESIANLKSEFEGFYPEYLADQAWDDNITRYLLVFATDRSFLDRIQSDIRPQSVELDRVFDRIHDFLLARVRTPRRTLDASEALELAQRHLAEMVKMRESRDPQGVAALLERLDQIPIVVREHSGSCKPGSQFEYYLGPPYRHNDREHFGLESVLSEAERSLLAFGDDFIDFDAMDTGFESDLTLAQIYEATDAMNHSMVLTTYLLQPCVSGPLDASSYYRLWEAGASLWATADSIEVRTFTAMRGTNAHYQG